MVRCVSLWSAKRSWSAPINARQRNWRVWASTLTVLIPPAWGDRRGMQHAEREHTEGYTLRVIPLRLNGNFHLHYYPTLRAELAALRPHVLHMDEEPYNLATWLALRAAAQVGSAATFFTWQNLCRRYPLPFAAHGTRQLPARRRGHRGQSRRQLCLAPQRVCGRDRRHPAVWRRPTGVSAAPTVLYVQPSPSAMPVVWWPRKGWTFYCAPVPR